MFWFSLCAIATGGEITVSTLNIGHGRGAGSHQFTQSKGQILQNIDLIAEEVLLNKPDVLGLQEADIKAWWSGNTPQSAYLASLLQMSHVVVGEHSHRKRLNYGTSLISQDKLQEVNSQRTPSTFPLPPKGFVVATVMVEEQPIVVVSIHLDPFKAAVRESQIDRLVEELTVFEVPRIIMGDFNVEWGEELHLYCSRLNVSPYEPLNQDSTFPKLNRRLDWILASEDLEFIQYQTHDVTLSDHKLLSATLVVSNN
jgi:endonuclease/exonuclease/phosphatase family metal-dependent hydrolase